MPADYSRAYKVIALMGGFAFAFLWGMSFMLRTSVAPDEKERVRITGSHSDFQAASAAKFADALLSLPPATSPHEAIHAIRACCEDAVTLLNNQSATAGEAPRGAVAFEARGSRADALLLVTTYALDEENRILPQSAANLAFALELQRSLDRRREGYTVRFLCQYRDTRRFDRAMIPRLLDGDGDPGLRKNVVADIIADNVGDCYLQFRSTPGATQSLEAALADAARSIGQDYHFRYGRSDFTEESIIATRPYISLVDFQGPISTMEGEREGEGYCPDSLKAAGDVLINALPSLEHQLNTRRISG